MTQQANTNRFHLGFLRATLTEQGYVGGLLVTNHLGRPLEFQCTTPVRPNRTQQILYGSTLEPFIYSELIGKTLYERLGVKPQLIIVLQENLLEVRRQVEVPTGVLVEKTEQSESSNQKALSLGRQFLLLHPDFPADEEVVAQLRSRMPADADMLEPLERVSDALKETLRANNVA